MTQKQRRGAAFAVLAAAFYALNAPFSKLLMADVPPSMMASMLYLGAGFGMAIFSAATCRTGYGAKLGKRDLPYVIGMILLDIAAPISLMLGIRATSTANASLLNNFEIVATSLIALAIFRERISPRLWLGIGLVTLSSILLSVEDVGSLSLSAGSLLVLLACVCWGFENNCTRMLSGSDPVQIVVLKGIFSGLGALMVALLSGESFPELGSAGMALVLGFVAYGLSIVFYIYAQRELGAAKTSAYYAIAPFIGVALSLVIFRETPSGSFLAALAVMIAGTWAVTTAESA